MHLPFSRKAVFGAKHPTLFAVSAGILGVTLFLVPLFSLPLSADSWEASKAFVLVLGVCSALILAAVVAYRERMVPNVFTRWDLLWLGFFGAVLLSTIFSVHPETSIVGLRGMRAESLLTFGGLLGLLVLLRIVFRDVRLLLVGLGTFVLAMTVTAFLFLLGVLGFPVLGDASTLPLFANSLVMAAAGSALSVLVFLFALFTPALRHFRLLLIGGLVIHGLLLLIIDMNVAWYTILLGLFGMFALLGARKALTARILISLIAIAALAFVLVFADMNAVTHISLQSDLLLGHGASAEILRGTFAAHPILGSGPGTFLYDYFRFAPPGLYEAGGGVQFTRAGNAWWGWLATLGIGALLLLAIIALTLARILRRAAPHTRSVPPSIAFAQDTAFLLILAILFISLFFPIHLVLLVLLFLAFGIADAALAAQTGRVRHIHLPRRTGLLHIGLTAALVLLAASAALVQFRVFWAEAALGSAVVRVQKNAGDAGIENRLRLAALLAPWEATYKTNLAEHLAFRVSQEQANTTQDRLSEIHSLIAEARKENPLHPGILNAAMRIHLFLGAASPYTLNEVEEILETRMRLESAEARHYLDYARFFLERYESEGAAVGTDLLTQAEKALTAAKERNGTLPAIDFTRARLLSLQEKHEEAIGVLTALVKFYPQIADYRDALAEEYSAIGDADSAEKVRSEELP